MGGSAKRLLSDLKEAIRLHSLRKHLVVGNKHQRARKITEGLRYRNCAVIWFVHVLVPLIDLPPDYPFFASF